MKLKCYCCGAAVGKRFSLVALQDDTDRVFIMLPEHTKRVEDGIVLNVTAQAPRV